MFYNISADPFQRLKKFFVLLVTAFLLVTINNFAPDLYAEAGVLPKWPHETSDLPPDPSVMFGRLANGFRYVIKENHEPKDRVSMHLVVHAGSLMEAEDQRGVAHFLEHLQFNGSAHFKPGELIKYFQSIGMQFGPDANAHTGFDWTVYDVVLSKGDKASTAGGLLVLKDYAEGALLLPEEIDRERGVVLAEKRSRDSADYRTFVSTLGFQFPEARIPIRLPIGEESVIKSAGRETIKSFYDIWYRPERMILVVVGDVDTKTLIAQIDQRFSAMFARAHALPQPDVGPLRHSGDKIFYHYEPETGNTSVSINAIWRTVISRDSLAIRKEELLGELADNIVRNRLNALIQKIESPFTSAGIHSGRYLGDIKYAEITADCEPGKWQVTLSAIERVLRGAVDHGFTPSELDRVKKDCIANLRNAVKQASTRKSRELAQEIISAIEKSRVYMAPDQEEQLLSAFVNGLNVEAVHAAFCRTWDHGHRLFLVTGNALITDKDSQPEAKIQAVVDESRLTAVSKPSEEIVVRFPYLPVPTMKGEILDRSEFPDLGITQITFDNGLRLNLKRTDFEADKIRFTLSFGHGKSNEPASMPGLAILADAVVNESGLGALTKDELEKTLAGTECRLTFHVEEDYFSFTGEAPSQELELVIQRLYAQMNDPSFRPEAFKLAAERLAQKYHALERDIEGAIELKGKRFLSGDDSRFGLPPYPQFQSLTLADVKEWLTPHISEAPIEISIVGDFDEKRVIELVKTYFSGPEDRKRLPLNVRKDLPSFPVGKVLAIDVPTQIPKGLVVIAYPTSDFWDIQRTRRLSVLADVFTEKLRETIREKLGVSYSPFAYNRSSRAYAGYGLLQAFIYVDPNLSEKVVDEVKKIESDLTQHGVSAEELSRALSPILSGIKEMRSTNNYWLRSVLVGSALHPDQLDWSRNMVQDFSSITREEISEFAKRYLSAERAARIIIRPQAR